MDWPLGLGARLLAHEALACDGVLRDTKDITGFEPEELAGTLVFGVSVKIKTSGKYFKISDGFGRDLSLEIWQRLADCEEVKFVEGAHVFSRSGGIHVKCNPFGFADAGQQVVCFVLADNDEHSISGARENPVHRFQKLIINSVTILFYRIEEVERNMNTGPDSGRELECTSGCPR